MNHKNRNHRLTLSLILMLIFISAAFAEFDDLEGEEDFFNNEPTGSLQSAQSKAKKKKASKKEEAKQDYSDETPENFTKRKYSEIVSAIDSGQTISSSDASQLLKKLKENQSAVGTFKGDTLTKHYLLTAWANFFNKDINRARTAARRAYKENAWSKDSQITQAAMAILTGKKPSPKPKEPPKKDTSYGNSHAASIEGGLEMPSYSSSNQNETAPQEFKLKFDSLDMGLMGAKIREMKLNCLNSTSLEYKYGTGNICILLWKIPDDSPAPDKTNSVAPSVAPVDSLEEDFMSMSFADPSNDLAASPNSKSKGDSQTNGLDAFKNIFANTMALPGTMFVAINMDTLDNREKILNDILEKSWPWANVMLQDAKSNASQFNGLIVEQNKPLLLVADNTGTIKYAGPATGFLSPMVVNQMSISTPAKTSFADTFEPKATANDSADAADTTASQKSRFLTDKPATQMSMEDEFQAGKLLENARMLIKAGSRYTTPKRGIELCRQIIKDYPSTKFADESRLLLRKVPERYRKRYNITDEELGL